MSWNQMPVGNGHHWNYTNCEVQEVKCDDIEWDFLLTSTKRRIGGWNSGRYWRATPNRKITDREAPLGSQYKWLHIGVQHVEKTEPDAYTMSWRNTKLRMEPNSRAQTERCAARLTEIASNIIEHSLTTPEKRASEYMRLTESRAMVEEPNIERW